MKERGPDRRNPRGQFVNPASDQRRPQFERRVGGAPAQPGVIQPGVGEAKPTVERRRYLDGGME